jgi:hypothetical protein
MDRAGSGAAANLGTLSDRLTNIAVVQNQVWRQLPLAVAGAVYRIVKIGEQGQANGRLRPIRAQREQLKQAFGANVRRGMQAGQPAVDGAAALLYKQLADPNWWAEDE